jgi:hypothetical protein
MGTGLGDRMLTALAALAMHAVTADAAASGKPATPETLFGIPLSAVAEAATSKADYEFLAGTAAYVIADPVGDDALRVIRLLSYGGSEQGARWMFNSSHELHRALVLLIERSPRPVPRCGDLRQWPGTAVPNAAS